MKWIFFLKKIYNEYIKRNKEYFEKVLNIYNNKFLYNYYIE